MQSNMALFYCYDHGHYNQLCIADDQLFMLNVDVVFTVNGASVV
jgi:hypothetical protein